MKPLLVNDRPEIIEEFETSKIREDNRRDPVRTLPGSTGVSGMPGATFERPIVTPSASSRIASNPSCDLMTLRSRLLSASSLRDLQNAAAQVAQLELNATLVAWFYPPGHQTGPAQSGQAEKIEGILCPADGISKALHDQFRNAALEATRRCEPMRFTVNSNLTLFAIPAPGMIGQAMLVVSEVASAGTSMASIVPKSQTSLLLLSSWISEWMRQSKVRQATENADTVAALIELVSHVQSSDTVESACQRLAEMLGKHLHAEKVTVGLCRHERTDCRIAAISGGGVIDPFSEETRLVESVLQESLIRAAGAVYPAIQQENRHSLLSHQQLAESGFGKTLVSMPIRTETGSPIGSILLTFNDSNTAARDHKADVREAERFLRAGAASLAGCLSVLQKLADSRILTVIRTVRAAFTTSRLQLAGWGAIAIATVLMVPLNYRVACPVELQPVERHYVAAPFAGPLEECLVEPGDVVTKNQLLARMDGREIRWELAEVQASLNKATKERNTHVSSRDFGNAAVLAHEIQRLEQRSQLLAHRDASLEIRSPADGVVVSGDHREAEGVPLETGQTLFEIAPLNRMVIELRVPEEDLRHVQPGMAVTVQLDAVPEESIEAVVRIVHPRAELHDGENVFIAEADVQNDAGLFRPGMRGSGRIVTGRRPLGWNLFHKPVAWVLGWLGW